VRKAAAAAAVVVLAACGSRHEPLRVIVAKVQTSPPRCTVVLVLDDTAGRATRQAIERLALGAAGTKAIVFVPKSVELAWLIKRHPEMGHPTHNALPDRYEVTFDTETHGVAAAERLRRVPHIFQTIGPYDCQYLGQP
jgi:cell division protein FtsX